MTRRAAPWTCRLALALLALTPLTARAQAPAGPVEDDGVHTVLCFSGGGTRAAAFSHGAARGLLEVDAGGVPLLERVDRLVGVSGGSLTAAQVALDRSPEALERFERLVLRDDLERAMARAAAADGVSFLLRDLTRGDVAAATFAERLAPVTFADLPERPELWIQTTDVVNERPVALSRDGARALGLDPATLPVARALAASTAFPGIFPPVRIDISPVTSSLFLADGGVLDNLGLEPALDGPPPEGARALVVVVVNARCALGVDEATLRSSVRSGLRTVELQQRRLDELVLARARARLRVLELEARLAGRPLETRLVVVDFAGSPRKEDLDRVGTRFALSDDEVTLLIDEGRRVARARGEEVAGVFEAVHRDRP